MTSDLTLYQYGVYLLGAFTVIIILVMAFSSNGEVKLTDCLTAAFTFALAAFTAALVYVGLKQTEILDKTDQTLKATQRPWVSVGPAQPVGDFEYVDSGASFAIDFGLRNSGHSPALNVEMDGEMRIFASSLAVNFQAFKIQNLVCDRLRTRPTSNSGSGFTLVPDQVIPQRMLFSVDKQEINAVTLHFPNSSIISPFIIGCVRYVFYADSSQHETGFVYYVPHLRTDQGNIPHDQISLISLDFGSGRTN